MEAQANAMERDALSDDARRQRAPRERVEFESCYELVSTKGYEGALTELQKRMTGRGAKLQVGTCTETWGPIRGATGGGVTMCSFVEFSMPDPCCVPDVCRSRGARASPVRAARPSAWRSCAARRLSGSI